MNWFVLVEIVGIQLHEVLKACDWEMGTKTPCKYFKGRQQTKHMFLTLLDAGFMLLAPVLKAPFSSVYLLGTPADSLWFSEDALPQFRVGEAGVKFGGSCRLEGDIAKPLKYIYIYILM